MQKTRWQGATGILFLTLLSSYGASASAAAPAAPVTEAKHRFLTQASFGPTRADIDALIALGDSKTVYRRWVNKQLAIPPSLVLPLVQQAGQTIANPVPLNNHRQDAWFRNAMHGPDQLRQRVAWALSQIMVVSQKDADLRDAVRAGALPRHARDDAFGNFRDAARGR